MTAIRLVLYCPECQEQHIDEGGWAERPHRTHRCAACRHEWRPSGFETVGVAARDAREER